MKRLRQRHGFTLVELMMVLTIISILGAIAYPRMSDTLRKMRARDGAKAVVNAVLNARSQAMIRNIAYQVTLASSSTVGTQAVTRGTGGLITVRRSNTPSCTAAGTALTDFESYDFQPLKDVSLCLVRNTTSPAIDDLTPCTAASINLCVTPDGTITNLASPNDPIIVAYVREFNTGGSTPTPSGVVRQVVIPRRRSVYVSSVQVSNDTCM